MVHESATITMIQRLAWVFGIVLILIGVLGFVPALAPGGLLFGIFSFDVMHNAIHLLSGVLAILAAWKSEHYSQLYFKVFGIIYAIATVFGFLQGDTVLGLIAVNTADNILNLIVAAVALWAGFGAKTAMPATA